MASIDLTIRNKKKEAKRYEAYLKKLGKKKVEQKKGEKPYVVPPMRTHGFLLQEGDAKRRRHLDYRYEDCQSLHMSFLAACKGDHRF